MARIYFLLFPGIHRRRIKCLGCHAQQRVKTPNDPTPAGRTFKVDGSDHHNYVLSLCFGEVDRLRLIPKTNTLQNTRYYKCITDPFFAYHSTFNIPIERNCNLLGIAAEQREDEAYSKILTALQSVDSSGTHIDPGDHRATSQRKHIHQFFFWSKAPPF